MSRATKTKYTPTHHAIDRARIRFGIASESVAEWINAIMKDAKYVSANGKNQLIYESKSGDIRLVIDDRTKAVITLHSTMSVSFLRPALEREIRKLRRETTRRTRAIERKIADAYAELAEQMANFANAKNPNTRALIEERIRNSEAKIEELKRSIERIDDGVQAKIKAVEMIVD